MLEAVFLRLPDDLRYLLKGTEHDHAGSVLFALGRLFFEQSVAECEILSDVKAVIRVECRLVRLATFAVLVVATHIPVGTAGIKVAADVIRDIRNDKLRPRNAIALVVLEIVVYENTLHITQQHHRPYRLRIKETLCILTILQSVYISP